MEFLVRAFDSTNIDPELDRRGCRKIGMVDAEMPDGHSWGDRECLPRFAVIKCTEIQNKTDLPGRGGSGLRETWQDNFDYEILATRPSQGEYDVRVFETNPGASNLNQIIGNKASRIQGFLQGWGCSAITTGTNEIRFTFSLWNSVRSINFWEISVLVLAQMSFSLDSYNPATGIGRITVTGQAQWPAIQMIGKITERGGTIITANHPSYTFEIERSNILNRFRQDVKQKIEQVFMYQRHRFNQTIMDAAIASGGILTLTKAELLAGLRDLMAE